MLTLTAVRKNKLALKVNDFAGDGDELYLVLLRRFLRGLECSTHKHGTTLRHLISHRIYGYCGKKTAGVDLNPTLKHFERVGSVCVDHQFVFSAPHTPT